MSGPLLKIAVLTIGDELLNGELSDTNTRRIACSLERHGFRIREARSVGDQEETIAETLLELAGRYNVVLVTGGLGPTEDDRTARSAAKACKRHLALNDEALRLIREHFRRTGREMHPRNEKQALLPQKALIIPNPSGSAPGFRLQHERCQLFFLPGVPAEMARMLDESVLPQLVADFTPQVQRERVFTLLGVAEPRVEELVAAAGLPAGIEIGFGVDFPLVHLKLRASGPTADELLDHAEPAALRAIGDYLVARGEESLAQSVARLLVASGVTISLAESCTGGLIASQLTAIPGASAFLERAAVTYADSAKVSWLKIPTQLLEKEGAVSATTARLMARGIRRASRTQLGLAVTGIAGPTGGSIAKPLGTVFLALATEHGEVVAQHRFGGDRTEVRLQSACYALDLVRRHLLAPLPMGGGGV